MSRWYFRLHQVCRSPESCEPLSQCDTNKKSNREEVVKEDEGEINVPWKSKRITIFSRGKPKGRLPAVSSANSTASQLLGGELLCRSTTGPAHHLPHVWCDPWQPPAPRVRGAVRVPVLGDGVPEAVHVLLPKVLRVLPLRAAGHLRQQAVLPMLQRLEDQEGRPQVPVDDYWCYSFVAYLNPS